MFKMMRSRSGFTLVELIVVIVIVGILAAVAAPMMTANVNRAMRTEAVAALGSIRTAERLYRSEHATYTGFPPDLAPYLLWADLNGQYYQTAEYTIPVAGTNVFAAQAADATAGTVTIDHDGIITGA